MKLTNYLILDVAAAPIEGVEAYLEDPTPPQNYKNPDLIATWIAEKKAELASKAALDIDLARITAIGRAWAGDAKVQLCHDEAEERSALLDLAEILAQRDPPVLITFNGHKYDAPLVMRRCLYLGVPVPDINLDRYRSPNRDLWNMLSLNGAVSAHSLAFYKRRCGWSDVVKPLDGAAEANVPQTGDWAGLEASVRHDLEITRRLAVKMGLIA